MANDCCGCCDCACPNRAEVNRLARELDEEHEAASALRDRVEALRRDVFIRDGALNDQTRRTEAAEARAEQAEREWYDYKAELDSRLREVQTALRGEIKRIARQADAMLRSEAGEIGTVVEATRRVHSFYRDQANAALARGEKGEP
jgi:DNA repair exonuclease SbcCD ATPase subunit